MRKFCINNKFKKFWRQIKFILLLPVCLYGFLAQSQQVITSISAQDLIEQYFTSYGIQVSNIKFNGKQEDSIIGLFDNFENTNLGINKGIILSTARLRTNQIANSMTRSNRPSDFSGSNLYDKDLKNILDVNAPIDDACVIEFDFVASESNIVSFNYVFASIEYREPSFICFHYHDLAAFFLSGSDPITNTYIKNRNIALVPETDIPVGVSTIHYIANPDTSCKLKYLNQFSQYYVDNTNGTSITFPGFTKVLKAQAQVIKGEKYHLKLAIANVGDRSDQSMVFLEAGSFMAEPIRVQDIYDTVSPTGFPMAISNCKDITIKVTLPAASKDTVFLPIQYSGTAKNGVDCEKLPDTLCFLPNQLEYELKIKALYTGKEGPLDFFISIPKYLNSTWANEREVVQVSLLSFMYTKIALEMPTDTTLCQTDPPTKFLPIQPVVTGGLEPLIYSWQTNAKISSTDVLAPLLYPILHQENDFQLTVSDATGCSSAQKTIHIKAFTLPTLSIEKYPVESCTPYIANFKVHCTPEADYLNICAENKESNQQFCGNQVYDLNGLPSGSYNLQVKAAIEGCADSLYYADFIKIYESPQAVISPSEVVGYTGVPFVLRNIGNSMQAPNEWTIIENEYGGVNLYEGDSIKLLYDQPGDFTAILKTWKTYFVNGNTLVCNSSDTTAITVVFKDIYFPNVITPNGDGINDYFEIKDLDKSAYYKSNELLIFDRWGRRVFRAKPYMNNWNGDNLPTGTYFYQFKCKGAKTKDVEIQGVIEVQR